VTNRFNRERGLEEIRENPKFDVVVIGGGATGLGVAVDAASRGYRTLLLEQADFAKGTSSRSTKLVHGGVRYLAQGDVRLVFEALYERGLLLKNAPHLVRSQPFVIPSYRRWDSILYGLGLKIYDWMAGRYRFGKTALLNRSKVAEMLPNVETRGLRGGILYFDGQFDDARLAINLAQTCAEAGGVLVNYMRVTGLAKSVDGKVVGVKAEDLETGQPFDIQAASVVNATGVFVDEILRMDQTDGRPMVRPSQGVHIVLSREFHDGEAALMIPATDDGRVLFAVPWHDYLLVGTTDTPLDSHSLEPQPLEQEIDFILETLRRYLVKKPNRSDVLSVFAGLRPLAHNGNGSGKTKEISRSHKLLVSPSGMVTITGGKWTTYRKMAQDTVDLAIKTAALPFKACTTASLKIHGHLQKVRADEHLAVYGSDAAAIALLAEQNLKLKEQLHPEFPYTAAEVVWAVRHEMARTVEDVLARRLRVLFLNARAAIDMAPGVAKWMAAELRKDQGWANRQTEAFLELAAQYLPGAYHPSESTRERKADKAAIRS
jgi:glycerol-3-phosphate dehydrogenase